MYLFEPGDDTTVCVLKAVKPKKVKLFTGPPSHKEDDAKVVHELMTNADIRIVSGGTTSQIVARELGVEVKSSTEIYDKEVPPIAYIHGINLVTEGVLTLSKTIDRLKSLSKSLDSNIFKAKRWRFPNGKTFIQCLTYKIISWKIFKYCQCWNIVSKRFGTKTSCNWRARKDFSEVGQNRDYWILLIE